MAPQEIEFAQGAPDTEENRMRVTYFNLDPLHPQAIYPKIYKSGIYAAGQGITESMELTPAEAQWLIDVLTRLLRASQ